MKFGLIKEPVFSRKDDRGVFNELVNFGTWESLIRGEMKKNAEMGHHYHKDTILFFYLLKGKVVISTYNMKTKEKTEITLNSEEGYLFKPEEVRVLRYLVDSEFLIMKSKKYDSKNPDLIPYKMEI